MIVIRIILTAIFILVIHRVDAQTTTKVSNGPWSNASNWDNGLPTASINAIISTNNTNLNSTEACADLLIEENNRISIGNGNSLTVNGELTLETGADLRVNGLLIINGNILFINQRIIEVAGGVTFSSTFNIGQ